MEGVQQSTSGSVCVLRDVSLFTLVLPHASSASRTGCDDTDVAEALPRLSRYAFSPIALLPVVLRRVRRDRVLLLLIAPRWLGRDWFPDLIYLLDVPPLELPV